MDSQFDIVSAAIQDNLGQAYDYRSIMHYGSSAFSRNGHNTIEALSGEPQLTALIGTAMDLSKLDVIKVSLKRFIILKTVKIIFYFQKKFKFYLKTFFIRLKRI